MRNFFLCFLLITVCSCKKQNGNKSISIVLPSTSQSIDEIVQDTLVHEPVKKNTLMPFDGLADTTFVRLADFSNDFAYDMRYATENNFLKAKVYDCAECYTRVKTAKALIQANKTFLHKGVKIKFFDCYRPNSVQYKMWEIVPNPQYVANPVKGSIHNKGGAVDITLVDLEGKELDMGTDFDFFGKRAYHDNMDLPEEILANRRLLKETMEAHGFWSIRTEWWHYNLSAASNDKVANFKWDCND
ncbi:M15 family metallopeptidase [Flagellimonas pacifica]|uniref:D-alanyl-D-alanine dipeptidase n=1 Tax=Flagellimonas pacifica TaxID=1247520 RepID=A0A285MR19_9FLAO|nr:M15 family metallopeptidase [Allomuricauda parva]SNY99588.1 D-alanyl-D-alanine dipeptidase [Allomuricauda parva]